MQTQAVEDYLKNIFEIERTEGKVATTALAERMGVAPASVTGMIKKLAATDLVHYEPYQGVQLTAAGRRIALEVIRHHRLVELYLAEALGLPWDRVHDEADKWEHVLSEDVEARMDEVLGYPQVDPHGSPIPSSEGKIIVPQQQKLQELETGVSAVITEVSDHSAEMLRYLGHLGLYPGTRVRVQSQTPNHLMLQKGKDIVAVDQKAAAYIFVRLEDED